MWVYGILVDFVQFNHAGLYGIDHVKIGWTVSQVLNLSDIA